MGISFDLSSGSPAFSAEALKAAMSIFRVMWCQLRNWEYYRNKFVIGPFFLQAALL